MIKILKGATPQKLIEHQKTRVVGVIQSYDNMSVGCREELRRSLKLEQKNICAYCNQLLRNKTKIEHHCEQSICNGTRGFMDRRIDYSNMLLVCEGNKGGDQHCDTRKSEFTRGNGLPMTLNPLNQSHMDCISYTSSGTIKSSNSAHEQELNTLLNLNQKTLRSLRSKKIKNLLRSIDYGGAKPNYRKLQAIITDQLAVNSYYSNFPGICVFYQKKYTL